MRDLLAIESVTGTLSLKTRRALWCILVRLRTLSRAVLPIGLLVSAAFLTGLLVRELPRASFRFSSPTFSYLGKRLAVLAVVAFLVIPLLPCHNPPWACYGAAGASALGVVLYVGNLPVKI